ncbi:hypothetical protein Ato02nite_100950 [Paractinoplanes toevensis]|uniref:Uncharacterized protein n=1 Tax=Paractinoplanes toevensis TaxID=571911 RepID=A0A919WDK1_9ACTN|nr:hypothetical protein Ato02nite_100950 [Actinoplanes toevensis]
MPPSGDGPVPSAANLCADYLALDGTARAQALGETAVRTAGVACGIAGGGGRVLRGVGVRASSGLCLPAVAGVAVGSRDSATLPPTSRAITGSRPATANRCTSTHRSTVVVNPPRAVSEPPINPAPFRNGSAMPNAAQSPRVLLVSV